MARSAPAQRGTSAKRVKKVGGVGQAFQPASRGAGYKACATRHTSAFASSHSSASCAKKLTRDFLYSFVGKSACFCVRPVSMSSSLMIDSHSSTERACTVVERL